MNEKINISSFIHLWTVIDDEAVRSLKQDYFFFLLTFGLFIFLCKKKNEFTIIKQLNKTNK